MYRWCEHCDALMWCERSTKRFCSTKCRVAHNRGQVHTGWKTESEKLTEVANAIALHNPKAFAALETLRDYHGQRAVNIALKALADVMGMK